MAAKHLVIVWDGSFGGKPLDFFTVVCIVVCGRARVITSSCFFGVGFIASAASAAAAICDVLLLW